MCHAKYYGWSLFCVYFSPFLHCICIKCLGYSKSERIVCLFSTEILQGPFTTKTESIKSQHLARMQTHKHAQHRNCPKNTLPTHSQAHMPTQPCSVIIFCRYPLPTHPLMHKHSFNPFLTEQEVAQSQAVSWKQTVETSSLRPNGLEIPPAVALQDFYDEDFSFHKLLICLRWG